MTQSEQKDPEFIEAIERAIGGELKGENQVLPRLAMLTRQKIDKAA